MKSSSYSDELNKAKMNTKYYLFVLLISVASSAFAAKENTAMLIEK